MGQATLSDYLSGLPPPFDTRGGYDGAALSKVIRADLAGAVDAGVLPAGTKFSVRLWHHHSFIVEIVAWDGAVFTPHYTEWRMERETNPASKDRHGNIRDHYQAPDQADNSNLVWRGERGWVGVYDVRCTDALNGAVATANRIANRHNWDESDSQADYFRYGYSLNVHARSVEYAAEQGIAMESDPAMQDLARRAALAANALGAACVKSYCGRRGLAGADADTMRRLIALADKANGRPVMYDKRRRGWIVDVTVDLALQMASVESLAHDTEPQSAIDAAYDAMVANERALADASPTNTAAQGVTRYFRCFARGKNLGDTPVVFRDGRAYPADGSYGMIEEFGAGIADDIEARIVGAITDGKRGGTVKRGAALVQWSLI